MCRLDLSGSVWEQLTDCCEQGDRLFGFRKCGNFLNWLRTFQE